jgi:hypothetical protein
MAITASVSLVKNEYVAVLSDGRRIERHDWRDLAEALCCAGVNANGVAYEWHAGQRMITAGQQVAMRSEIRRRAHHYDGHIIAA